MAVRGRVISGSVEGGVEILLNRDEKVEDYPVGALVKIVSDNYTYIGLISDVKIKADKETYKILGSNALSNVTRQIFAEKFREDLVQQIVEVVLLAKIDRTNEIMTRADTLPNFYSQMVGLEAEDALKIMTLEEESIIEIGTPKQTAHATLDVNVPISVERLVDLSFAIYGKSGSGKTFLGNIIAMGVVTHDIEQRKREEKRKGVKLLIFDMHSEYGLDLKDNRGRKIADGVGQIFKDFFTIYTPDLELAKTRDLRSFKIPIDKLTIQDFELIGPIFGLSQTFLSHLSSIKSILSNELGLGELWPLGLVDSETLISKLETTEDGKNILARLKNRVENNSLIREVTRISSVTKDLIKKKIGVAASMSYATQISKLRRLLDYPLVLSDATNTVDEIVDKLVSKDESHVIISMGKYENDMPLYMMISNLVARRLRDKILEMGLEGMEPENKIVIFLEEAHKFLGRDTAHLSPFGEIAREMRKKGVILCIIDQKPGELDPNVVSMIWTNFVFNLTDRKDIDQALIGIEKPDMFKKIVPTLSPREILVFGHAVRFPAVLKVTDYKKMEELFKRKLNTINKGIKESEEILRESGFI